MFDPKRSDSIFVSALTIATLVYHNTVRSIRKGHRNAAISLLGSMMQSVLMIAVFVLMFDILGLRGSAVRGDFILFVMSGIFMFMLHTKSMGAVVGAEGPTSPMMNHLPMNTAIAIASAALGALYIQVLTMLVILGVYNAGWGPIEIYNPIGAMGMVLLAWFSGCAVGMVLFAMRPWFPGVVNVIKTVYARANMIASGKMFLANALPATMLVLFDWNPLFHIIDQTRGYTFINYNPHNSSISYAVYVSLVLMTLGLIGEFYTRRHASLSWQATR